MQSDHAENQHIVKINKVIAASKTAYNHLVILNSLGLTHSSSNCYFNKDNCAKINELFTENILSCSYISNDINIVFNFHLQSLLQTLTILTIFEKENPPLL